MIKLFELSTTNVLLYEAKYTGQKGNPISEIVIDAIKDGFDEHIETFLDEVFAWDEQISRKEW